MRSLHPPAARDAAPTIRLGRRDRGIPHHRPTADDTRPGATPPRRRTGFVAVLHRREDGSVHDRGRYVLLAVRGPRTRALGGALVTPTGVVAYAGDPEDGHDVRTIERRAVERVWGDTLAKALAEIRPALERRLPADT